ncbi:hypothetical protein ACIRQP_34910 [Streptomyces sp. NPDC102274]|uniref:hypothetical protein n=1 Tax=Streptomyces sp. NPDC102274 TaxID=3366151 RepID=UPI0038123E41
MITTYIDRPTVDDVARALANRISVDVPVRDIIANFSVRPQSASDYGNRSSGAPLIRIAERVHADLYGLPLDPKPAPASLRELADTSYEALNQDEQQAILEATAAQLPYLATVLGRAALWAERRTGIPEQAAGQFAHAAAIIRQLATDLAQAHRAFGQPTTKPSVTGQAGNSPTPPPSRGQR